MLVSLFALLGATAGVALSHGTRAAPGHLVAYDLATGAVRFDVTAPTASVHLHAIGEGVVVATGADDCNAAQRESAFAVSLADGALRWSRALRGACSDYAAPGTLGGGTVAVTTRHGVSGWSLQDGSSRWTHRGLGPPGQLAGTVVASNDGETVFLRARDGRVITSRPIIHDAAQAYTGRRTAVFVAPGGLLTGIDVADGRVLWRQRDAALTGGFQVVGETGGAFVVDRDVRDLRGGRLLWASTSSPIAVGAGLAFTQDAGELHALDIRTGALRWEIALPPPDPVADRQIVAGAGAVAVIDPDSITLLEASTGATRWRAALDPATRHAYPAGAIARGMLLIPATSPDWVPYDE